MVSYNCALDMSLPPSLAVTIPPPCTWPGVAALDTWSLRTISPRSAGSSMWSRAVDCGEAMPQAVRHVDRERRRYAQSEQPPRQRRHGHYTACCVEQHHRTRVDEP